MLPPDNSGDREVADSETTSQATSEAGEVPSIGGHAPWLDNPERFVLVSGRFDVRNVPDNVDWVLSENTDTYAPIIEALKTVDLAFDPKGYLVRAHPLGEDGGGDVTVTLYIEDIKTSAGYRIVIDGGEIRYVDVLPVYHPEPAEVEQALRLKADFEASPAGSSAVERVRASLRQDGVKTDFSQHYFYHFKSGRMLLYIKAIYTYDMGDGMTTSNVREEQIDCLEVLGR
jgi:hypothetical protein